MKWQKMLGDNYRCLPFLIDDELNYKPTPKEMMKNIYKLEIKNDFGHDFCFKQVEFFFQRHYFIIFIWQALIDLLNLYNCKHRKFKAVKVSLQLKIQQNS